MRIFQCEKRKSGIEMVGDLLWGSHFCLFYETGEDLLDILVPYFVAGLENNEFCVWATPALVSVEDAQKALKRAIPAFQEHMNRGQIEIIPHRRWRTSDGGPSLAVISKLDRAVAGGFDGLRLGCQAFAEKKFGRSSASNWADAIGRHNVIAAFGYPRDKFGAIGLMEVVKQHQFALVRNAGSWEVIESSEARIVKDALKRSEEKLHTIFSHMSEGFAYHRVILNDEGVPCDYVFLEVNDAFEILTGLRGKKIIGRKVTAVLPGVENDPVRWIEKYGRVALGGEPVRFESYSEALGKWFSISAFSPQRGYFAVIFNDITERKKAEESIHALNERLKQNIDELSAVNAGLEAFSHSVSHDLRAPLRGIAGYVEMLKKSAVGQLDDKGMRCIDKISGLTRQMGQLIEDLLAFSRTGRVEMKREPVDSNQVLHEISGQFENETKGRNITWDIQRLPEVVCDRTLLKAALTNLVSNALKYTSPREHAVIEIWSVKEGNEHVFHIRDNGVGFDMKYRDRLFGLFERLHRQEEFEGSGVGLANVQRIIERHGGRVWAEGEVERGATFCFTLPATEEVSENN